MTRTHHTYHETATLRGGVYADLGTGAAVQPFKYGDKELDLSNGIARYDYTARAYVPATLRFDRIDLFASSYPHISPYAFCANNPVNILDPTGNLIVQIFNGIVYTYTQNEDGEWGFYDDNGKQYTGKDYFAEPLKKIRESDPALDWMIKCIAKHPEILTLSINDTDELKNEFFRYTNNKMLIRYEPDLLKGGMGESADGTYTDLRDPEAGLAHELGHAFESMFSASLQILNIIHWNITSHPNKDIRREVISGIAENIYRQANGNAIRIAYSCKSSESGYDFNGTAYNYSKFDKVIFTTIALFNHLFQSYTQK